MQDLDAGADVPGSGSASSSSETCEQASLRADCGEPCNRRGYITARQLMEFKRKLSEQVLIDSISAAKP